MSHNIDNHTNALEPVQVTVYSKPNCSLCDKLMADLTWLQRELSFTIVSQDISDDPTLYEKFKYLIPVLEVNAIFYHPPHDLLQTRQRILTATRDGAQSKTA